MSRRSLGVKLNGVCLARSTSRARRNLLEIVEHLLWGPVDAVIDLHELAGTGSPALSRLNPAAPLAAAVSVSMAADPTRTRLVR